MFLLSREKVARGICEVNNFSLTHHCAGKNDCSGDQYRRLPLHAEPPFDMHQGEWYEEESTHVEAIHFACTLSQARVLMTVTTLSPSSQPLHPFFFAHQDDQDLDVDDRFEDFHLRRQPPGRRPFRIILAVLFVIGVGYVVMNPDIMSSLVNVVSMRDGLFSKPRTEAPAPRRQGTRPAPLQTPPVPAYYEEQTVTVVLQATDGPRLRLSNDAEGKQPGPPVKAGDVLTVLDGSLGGKTWVYFVRTQSGASGWIKEQNLQARS